jgi:hypothetical protein
MSNITVVESDAEKLYKAIHLCLTFEKTVNQNIVFQT